MPRHAAHLTCGSIEGGNQCERAERRSSIVKPSGSAYLNGVMPRGAAVESPAAPRAQVPTTRWLRCIGRKHRRLESAHARRQIRVFLVDHRDLLREGLLDRADISAASPRDTAQESRWKGLIGGRTCSPRSEITCSWCSSTPISDVMRYAPPTCFHHASIDVACSPTAA
jgi:hypothetical protein